MLQLSQTSDWTICDIANLLLKWFIQTSGMLECLRVDQWSFYYSGKWGQDKLSWLQRFYGMTPFPSNSLSFSSSLSPSVIPLSSFFFSPEQLEGQSGKRGMCEHALWGWGEGVREKVRDKERVRDGREKMRGRPVLIGLCGHAGLWWCSLAKPCLNSWPGLTCIPCIRPTTTNSSVLFGSFQCQAWESCATHIYALHFRRPLCWGGCEGSFGLFGVAFLSAF